jgi:hypothetical protein
MASNTNNVKMGVCKILYKGVDLGYTKGGVEVDVTTGTHTVNIDQFGESVVNQFINKRDIKVTCPLAETTLENLVMTMPGATMKASGAVKASGTITVTTNPSANDTITVGPATNKTVFTFKASATNVNEITIGADATATAANIVATLGASVADGVTDCAYTSAAGVVTVTYDTVGTEGNAWTLAKSSTNIAVSGATLSGGTNGAKRVDVTVGLETGSLLALGGKLVLHPIANGSDTSEDLEIPYAATPGGMKFAYKHNDERIFNVEFMGYPDPTTKVLFKLGDRLATA